MAKCEVPIWEKTLLTIDEAAAYTGVGAHKLRDLANSHSNLTVCIGTKRLYKRRPLDAFLEKAYVI